MKIVFVGSKNGYKKIPETFDTVLSVLKKRKIDILGPVTQKYEDVLSSKEVAAKTSEEVHAIFMRKVIGMADAMILESSFEGFALGHEATIALEQHKPVLAITQKDISFSFIHDQRFFANKYKSPDELVKIIDGFISVYNRKYRNIRVNLMLNQRHDNYLNWYSINKGVNRSSLVRQLLDADMGKNIEYTKSHPVKDAS